MAASHHHDEAPPPPPDAKRRVRIGWGQAIGLLLLALLPAGAALDWFGTHETVSAHSSPEVALTVEHATKVRYGNPTRVTIKARALRGAAAGPITVTVESPYLAKFMEISMSPEPQEIDSHVHTFVLPASNEEKVVTIELEPEKYGTARGRITANVANGTSPAEIALEAFAFP